MEFAQYPRPGDVTDYTVPTQQLQRFVQFGLIWGGLWILSSWMLSLLHIIWGPKAIETSSQFVVIAAFLLFYLIFALSFAVIVFQWVRLAWQTVLGMRKPQTRLAPNAAAWLSVIPYVNFVGLTYVMDFLVIRSRSKDERTMNAFSVTSSEPLATAFYYVLVIHFLTATLDLIPIVKKYIDTDSIGFTAIDMLSQLACYWLGYLISKKVNDQLKAAAIPPRIFS